MTRLRMLMAMMAATMVSVGCGSDFRPPDLATTGVPAAPLGRVIDLEVVLPHLQMPDALVAGLDLELRLELEAGGAGEVAARAFYGPARYDWTRIEAEVEDLGDGTTTVFVSHDRWTTGRLGPLRVEGVTFELVLDGVPRRDGWQVTGQSWESLTGTSGSFEGWRRHRFLVAGTDFFSSFGRVAEVALVKEREIIVRNGLEVVSSDAILRVGGGAAFAINRFTFDNLQRLDPQLDFSTTWQVGVGDGANPHDVAVYSEEKAYVSRYEPPFNDVAVFDPERGPVELSIPLESLADNPDGTPRADRMRLVEDALFVGLQDIDRTFTRFAEGKLAVIDPELDEVVGVIPLGGKNPGAIEVVAGADGRARLYVALAGIFAGSQQQELSGGVAVVDVGQRVLERFALDDDDAGGNVGALAMVSEDLGYVVATDENFVNRVLAFDPASATVRRTVLETADYVPEIEVDSDRVLAVPDRSFFEPGLCLYRVSEDPSVAEALIGCGALDAAPVSLEALD